MSYNVRYFGHAARPFKGAASTKRGVRGISRAIAALDPLPHIICMQEVEQRSLRSSLSHSKNGDEHQIDVLMDMLDAELEAQGKKHRYRALYYPAHSYGLGKRRLYTTGLATLVRDDLSIEFDNSDQPADITHRRNGFSAKMKQSRIVGHAVLRRKSEKLELFNTHLSLPAFVSKNLVSSGPRMGHGINQAREMQSLAEFVQERRASDHYVIVGDFNALPASPAYRKILELLNAYDPFRDHHGLEGMALAARWPTAGFLHLRMRLDHIFAGPAIEWLDFEGSHAYGDESGHWHELSDHVPIVGRFKLR